MQLDERMTQPIVARLQGSQPQIFISRGRLSDALISQRGCEALESGGAREQATNGDVFLHASVGCTLELDTYCLQVHGLAQHAGLLERRR